MKSEVKQELERSFRAVLDGFELSSAKLEKLTSQHSKLIDRMAIEPDSDREASPENLMSVKERAEVRQQLEKNLF